MTVLANDGAIYAAAHRYRVALLIGPGGRLIA
jgi:hypothetical protein